MMNPSNRSTVPESCCTPCCGPAPATRLSALAWLPAVWRSIDKPLAFSVVLVVAIALFAPQQLGASLVFTGQSLLGIAPWLALSVAFAAWAKASRADSHVAMAFKGSPVRMVVLASLLGALSPFCSCGVVPVIAGLLGAGVPLAPVMAFWMSSPLMDPEMFVLTAASLGMQFAIAKLLAAVAIGLFSGAVTWFLTSRGALDGSLRAIATGCCSGKPRKELPVEWNVLGHRATRRMFFRTALSNGWFLLRWMVIAFLVESLMVAWLPAEKVASLLGSGPFAVPLAVSIGIPAYLNGYAALPLVRGLMDLGMQPSVALAFLVGGGISSIPAATAVWALVKPRVFALYLALAFLGALGVAYAYGAFLSLIG